jgi:hypothetical protein
MNADKEFKKPGREELEKRNPRLNAFYVSTLFVLCGFLSRYIGVNRRSSASLVT